MNQFLLFLAVLADSGGTLDCLKSQRSLGAMGVIPTSDHDRTTYLACPHFAHFVLKASQC